MDFRKCASSGGASSISMAPSKFMNTVVEKAHFGQERVRAVENDVDVDLKEVYFLIVHFLSSGPCQRTFGLFLKEILEHELLPRRYHAWFSRSGLHGGNNNNDGISFPLSYNKLAERYPHIEKDHLVKLLRQLLLCTTSQRHDKVGGNTPNAAHVPTLLGSGSFSLLDCDASMDKRVKPLPVHLRWPHMQADQVHGLSLREIGGGFAKHHRAPSIRAACYTIAKPSTMVQKMQNLKKLRGHRTAVYCAIFDRTGRYVITGSDDRLVKIWSMETAFCLASCRGHEGDITDLAVSSNNALVASASNDFVIRVWRLPDGMPASVLQGHTGAVTAIAFSPRHMYQLLSSSDDGTCRIWDAMYSRCTRTYVPKPSDVATGKSNGPSSNGTSSSIGPQRNQILCCAYNANGTVFVTGSSDTFARVWSACKTNAEESEQQIHEMDVLSGHENDVNYVQFSGCAVASRPPLPDTLKEENLPKFKNSWFCHDNIVTCSRDGSAIIWIPRSRRSHGKSVRWTKAYHLKVPPPPLPPQPPRGGPRMRILPTPRGVNMIVWSLDNRFVLAAIMDCRICVWNAVDGSLVHSLTGHTESSYVLDVHPFNPRIAMSAGYDGRTIVWDIREGIPIRIYEIGRVKLVDGKFSPDGTSVVLSDDVGQIYLLNTGQGESHKDAKYDQFFLGDYRPLIRDAAGHVLDQETQLPPFRRNVEDPLCDSSLIPYPEPYQTMFQQRRLGALGCEWRPSSLKLAVGPDISLGQDYQLPPLEDLDRMIEPLPEFIDAIYWEPENEVISDDTDSEYNVAEEFSSECGQGSLFCSSPSDPDCGTEESEVEHGQKDGLRRSRRRKHKTEVELMTSSGRRVKKRNLSERNGSISGSNGSKKLKSGRKVSKRKSSIAKASRPQRLAARNALSMFSRVTGTSSDEDDSEDDASKSDSELQDSNIQVSKSERYLENVQQKCTKEERLVLAEDIARRPKLPESQSVIGNRKKLVLKFSLRDSKKSLPPKETRLNDENHPDFVNPPLPETRIGICSRDPGSSSTNVCGVEPSYNQNGIHIPGLVHPKKVGKHVEESAGDDGNKIKWGEVTSKQSRLRDLMRDDASAGIGATSDAHKLNMIDVDGNEEQFAVDALQDRGDARIEERVPSDSIHKASFESSTLGDLKSRCYASAAACSGTCDDGDRDGSQEVKENLPPKFTRLKIRTKGIPRDSTSSSKLKDLTGDGGDMISKNPSFLEQNQTMGVPEKGVGSGRTISLYDVHKMQDSHKWKSNFEGFNGAMEENAATDHCSSGMGFPVAATDDTICRTRSMKMKVTARELNAVNHTFRVKVGRDSVGTSKKAVNEVLYNEKMSSSKMPVRSRSARNRQDEHYGNDVRFSSRWKSNPSARRKLSWLILSKHEEGYRYIPQLGDEVVYLRQGHQEYIEANSLQEKGPWSSIKGYLSAVETCKVESLDYAPSAGSGEGCCKITLKFIDPLSCANGKAFKLTLPELINFPDFIVEKTRYDAAMSRNWTHRDKCQVWWKNENGEDENGEDGSWWEGRIVSVQAKSDEFPNSPWERYCIRYRTDPSGTPHLHCPWEVHELDIAWEHPHIDFEIRDQLLHSFDTLEQSATRNQDRYGIEKLNEASHKLDFFNRFPVPLCPEIIYSRLQNNYYRSLEAVKNDIRVMMENAQAYFARSVELSNKMKRLSEWYTRKLLKLQERLS